MFSRTVGAILFIIPLGLALASCAGNGPADNAVMPSGTSEMQATLQIADGGQKIGHQLWGYWQVYVNPEKLEFEIVPAREVATHWNVLKWLEQGPCTNCFKIVHIEPSGTGTFLCDIQIKHPFPSPNLTGFDVRGIAMFDGTHYFPEAVLTISDLTLGEGELVNADGYTKLYNASTEGCGPGGFQGYTKGKFATLASPDAMLNGYKRHVSDDPANTRNAFFAGDSVTVQYEIKMPTGPFVFGYAVDANWVSPTVKPVTDPMTQFPTSANSPEPWKIVAMVEPVGDGLTDTGGSAKLAIDVYDWQGKNSYDEPTVECPELFDGAFASTWKSNGTGYATFEVEVSNSKLAGAGTYLCLIKVVDKANDIAPDWLYLTAYQIVSLEVIEDTDQPPVAQATADPLTQTVCLPVDFNDDGSYDPDGGPINKYEWDWNNDGTFDEEGNHVSHTWDVPGDYQVQFRVTDDENSADVLDTPLSIHIQNEPPIASASFSHFPPTSKITILTNLQFDGSNSVDGDCMGLAATKWEWDWENDGTFDAEGSTQTHMYDKTGHYEVQLRVTDDEGATDMLDSPLEIDVVDFGWAIAFGAPAGETIVQAVAAGEEGDIYCTGTTWFNADFDPWGGTSEPSEKGIFIASYTPAGHYRWAHSWTTAGTPDVGYDIVIDGLGNLYVTGRFTGAKDFDPGPGVDNHTADGASDVILLKFTTDGDYVWGRSWGHSGWDYGRSVAVGDSGNKVFVGGDFVGSVDFDPDIGYSYWRTANGEVDAFLSAFDSTGNFLWANTWGGVETAPYTDHCWAVTADNMGNVYVGGSFVGTADFDPGSGVHNLVAVGAPDVQVDGYLASYYQTNGLYIWAYPFSGSGNYQVCRDAAVEPSGGYVYATGSFDDPTDFDFGAGAVLKTPLGYIDSFLAKYDFNGNYQWVSTWGGSTGIGYTNSYGLSLGPNATLVVSGSFENIVDFDPGPAHSYGASNGEEDAYALSYSTAGVFGWAGAWGGTTEDCGYGCASDGYGNCIVGGYFNSLVDFDPSGEQLTWETPGAYEWAFISKFLPDGSW